MEKTLSSKFREEILFHGTPDLDTVRCICSQGFDMRVCGRHGTMYGEGVYFAQKASYSSQYTGASSARFMFRAQVLVGQFTQGLSHMKRPPNIDSRRHGALYDSVVDNVTSPSIFVVFENSQAYPTHLIEYDHGSDYQSVVSSTQSRTLSTRPPAVNPYQQKSSWSCIIS